MVKDIYTSCKNRMFFKQPHVVTTMMSFLSIYFSNVVLLSLQELLSDSRQCFLPKIVRFSGLLVNITLLDDKDGLNRGTNP